MQNVKNAEEFKDYFPFKDTVVFNHGENEKIIYITICKETTKQIESKTLNEIIKEDEISNEEEEGGAPDSMFKIVIEKPEPNIVKLSRKNIALVTISEAEEGHEEEDNTKLIQFFMAS